MTSRDIILSVCKKNKYNWENTYKDIKEKVKVLQSDTIEQELLRDNGDMEYCITIIDKDYCKEFKKATKPPFMYLYRGLDIKNRHYNFINIIEDTYTLNNFRKKYKNVDNILYINNGCIYSNEFCITFLDLDYEKLIEYAMLLCDNIIIAPEQHTSTDNKIVSIGCYHDKNIYVIPTLTSSNNNELIKNGALLFDENTEL